MTNINWIRILIVGLVASLMAAGVLGYQWWNNREYLKEQTRVIEAIDEQLRERSEARRARGTPTMPGETETETEVRIPEGTSTQPVPEQTSEPEQASIPEPTRTAEPEPVPTQVNETGFPLTFPDGFRISLFTSSSLGPIRFMAFSPDGILFVSMPSSQGLYKASGGGKIYALPDRDRDGKADEVKTVISGLGNLPHGIAFYSGYLYIAEEDSVARYPYQNDGNVGAREVVVNDLADPGDHVSRTIGFSSSGKMYVSVGSSCNVCEESDARRAAILEYNSDGSGFRVFARGIRNAVGFVFHPETGEIWATENGRDELGEDLPPDEINIIRDGQNYGWPYCYGKNILDPFGADIPGSLCIGKEPSLWDIQAHSASLGLRFIEGSQFPQGWQGDLLVAYHGSWDRTEPTGYKVARLNVQGNKIVSAHDFISGWLRPDGSKLGRPVDVIFDPSDGALYISDDKTGLIYRVTKL